MQQFTIIIHDAAQDGEGESGFWGEVEELPGCMSQGETEDELLTSIVEAIHMCLDAGSVPVRRVKLEVEHIAS